MIELENDSLVFSFSEIHQDAHCSINFQRTLRLPDDNREYPLPPGLARFPLSHVDDYGERVPGNWLTHGGVFLPMYQAEAMWLNFKSGYSNREYPCAIKIAAGKINAITGEQWTNSLSDSPQNYLVIPSQPWLDGFYIGKGQVRQFVAMLLGDGYSAEEQLTGDTEHGGIQIIVYPMKREKYKELEKESATRRVTVHACEEISFDMGLAPGGLMRQEIYEDHYGIDAWDTSMNSRCFVHIANSLVYFNITGIRPPTKPPTAEAYTKAGLPWFDYFDDDAKALEGSEKLTTLDSVAAQGIKQGKQPLPENGPVKPRNVRILDNKMGLKVREGHF